MRTAKRCLMVGFAAAAAVAAIAGSAGAADDGFVALFDGKTLTGWKQLGGTAKYTVEDGTITGTAVPNTPNSFLCTKKHYGDFILELEFNVSPKLNSGVQIRSNSFKAGSSSRTPSVDTRAA